jgi:SAM-dependent methyltransferase
MKSLNIQNNIEMWGDPSTWQKDGDEWSTQFGSTQNMWDEIIHPKISQFLRGDVLEIAPGYGRITEKLLEYDIDSLEIVDLNSNCIDRCQERFGDKIQGYFTNSGTNLYDFSPESKDFILSWDSFVHMDEKVIESYLKEIHRVLKPGGIAWIHHSNLWGGSENNWNNMGGRTNMNLFRFAELGQEAELSISNQETIKWGDEKSTLWDGISTLKKEL